MTLRSVLGLGILFILLAGGLFAWDRQMKEFCEREEHVVELLAKDVTAYEALKHLNQSMQTLQQSFQEIERSVKVTKMTKEAGALHVTYTGLSPASLDRLVMGLMDKGHVIKQLDVQKKNNLFDVSLRVAP